MLSQRISGHESIKGPTPEPPFGKFRIVLIKPSKYDDDGYVSRFWKGVLPQQTHTKGQENTMLKQIEICGQRFELYSPDQGRTWSSSPRSIVAYGQRKKMLRLELQKRFERIDEMQDPDPDNITELEIPMSLVRR